MTIAYESTELKEKIALSDGEAILVLAKAIFLSDPRIVAHVAPQSDAKLGVDFSLERYDAAFERAWKLGENPSYALEWKCQNEAISRASHLLVWVRALKHTLILLPPAATLPR